MYNYKMIIQYDGTKYNGWQKQGNTKNTIQEKFETVISRIIQRKTEVFASGRTDAGVHANAQVANFKTENEIDTESFLQAINHYLPEDIAVLSVEPVSERFHSRLNAVSKTYEYTICTRKPDVFKRKYVYYIDAVCDIEKMKSAALKLCGTHDFSGFSSVSRTKKSTVRTVNSINITKENHTLKISINATGFLYNMVRIISGTLLDIGLGKLDESAIDRVFESKSRQYAGTTLPPCGLMLMQVYYD